MVVRTNSKRWVERAACGGSSDPRWIDGAYHFDLVDVCGGCPVRSDCLLDALRGPVDLDAGIRGGLTPEQRTRVRRGRVEPWTIWEKQGHPYRGDRGARSA